MRTAFWLNTLCSKHFIVIGRRHPPCFVAALAAAYFDWLSAA